MRVCSSCIAKVGSGARTMRGLSGAPRVSMIHTRRNVTTYAANGGSGRAGANEKKDNRARQEIEQAYYEEWERLTLIPEEELNRPLTPSSFAKFLPVWLRYNALPGPIRYWLFKDKISGDGL